MCETLAIFGAAALSGAKGKDGRSLRGRRFNLISWAHPSGTVRKPAKQGEGIKNGPQIPVYSLFYAPSCGRTPVPTRRVAAPDGMPSLAHPAPGRISGSLRHSQVSPTLAICRDWCHCFVGGRHRGPRGPRPPVGCTSHSLTPFPSRKRDGAHG